MSDAARFLAAIAERDAEGMTPGQLADWLEEQGTDPSTILRLRVGAVALLAALDVLTRRLQSRS